ncbi:MAG TPA: hypothetical protein VL974_06240 [Magnetospirillum sp.]|jgi:hypothetical protein|nr:hypothetical protein [Magnetospirillum sp.]
MIEVTVPQWAAAMIGGSTILAFVATKLWGPRRRVLALRVLSVAAFLTAAAVVVVTQTVW